MAFIRKEGKFYKVYFSVEGRKHKLSTRSVSHQVAEMVRKKIENDLAIGRFHLEDYQDKAPKRLKEFFEEALAYSRTNKAPRTWERDKLAYKNFLAFAKDIALPRIDFKLIESYKAYLQKRGLAPGGVNTELRHLSAAFSVAVRYGYLPVNPFKGVAKVKTPKRKPHFLSPQQADELLEHTRDRLIYHYIFFALNTGARRSEICGLRWKDVDLDNGTLRLYGKGSKERTVPISDTLDEYLRERKRRDGYVMPGARNASEITHQFRKYADQLGLHEFNFHSLRHTYASWLVQNGVNLKIIQELLGHESITTTMVYAHLAPDSRFHAMRTIDNVFSKSKQPEKSGKPKIIRI